MNLVKIIAILTVLVANLVLSICALILVHEQTCSNPVQPGCHIGRFMKKNPYLANNFSQVRQKAFTFS
jgi:hypothetical protein